MQRNLYLNLTPEALVASMLPPEDFGKYLAVGTHSRSNEQAIFVQLDIDAVQELVTAETLEQRCLPHEDGSPRRSSYLGIYRVLEKIPLNALQNMYLVTSDGRVLELQKGEIRENQSSTLNLYQELAPMQPMVASSLHPQAFSRFITDREQPVSVEKVAFCDLRLDDLGEDPIRGLSDNLPYRDIPHLRDCLNAVWRKGSKDVKVVFRKASHEIFFRMVRSGFYIGQGKELVIYPFPSLSDLESKHYEWWRSAQF